MEHFKSYSRLTERIAHLEDLGVDDFIKYIENIKDFSIAEKMDGTALNCGFDTTGKFYTARDDSKSNYSETDYKGLSGAVTTLKVAHRVLKSIESTLKKYIKDGEEVQIEILFGRQPNAVVYGFDGFNYISFLRMLKGKNSEKPDQTKIKELITALKNKTVAIETEVVDTVDGTTLAKSNITTSWKFNGPQEIKPSDLDTKELKKTLSKLKVFLKDPSTIKGLTNYELATVNLTSVPKEKREDVKKAREFIEEKILKDYKLSIKEILLNTVVRKITPHLQDKNISNDEDLGVEGVVFLDPETEEQFKIVDRDMFTAINTFNYQVRSSLSGMVHTDKPTANLESRGGMFGEMKIRIANIFNIDGLGRSSGAKAVFEKFKGKNESETLNNFLDSINALEFTPIRTKIIAIVDYTEDELTKSLQKFKKEYKDYKLTLKSGKTIGYSTEVVKRTLLTFAEVASKLHRIKTNIKNSKDMGELVTVLFGSLIKAIHEKQISESAIMTTDFKNKSTKDFLEAYLGVYLAALVLIRIGDKKAANIMRDTAEHNNLKHIGSNMSPLNSWGMYIFNSDLMKTSLSTTTAQELRKIAGRFLSTRVKEIHNTIGSSKNLHLDWEEIDENIRVLTLRFEIRNPRINVIRSGLLFWDKIDIDEKSKVLSNAFTQLQLGDSSSVLLQLLRAVNDKVLMNMNMETKPRLVKSLMKLVTEDGDGGDAGAAAAPAAAPNTTGSGTDAGAINPYETTPANPNAYLKGATSSANIASLPFKLFKGKIVKRIIRKMGKHKTLKK